MRVVKCFKECKDASVKLIDLLNNKGGGGGGVYIKDNYMINLSE